MSDKELLRRQANALPQKPGVYIMKNADGRVIYVGKSKSLHNRVSQYFQGGGTHNEKTRRMVSSVSFFDYILTDTEIEALALENKLIKLYRPRYNILLKDGKSYPYIRLERKKDAFPFVSVTRARKKDGGEYFGPFSGMKTAYGILETAQHVFLLPGCRKRFPENTGRIKPCLYMQMKQCLAPCVSMPDDKELETLGEQLSAFLSGSIGQIKKQLYERMTALSEELRFESAALMRDRLKALDRLGDRQKVVGRPGEEYDVISLCENEKGACICVLYVRDGALLDSEYIDIGSETILDGEAVCSALCELCQRREYLPREMLVDYPLTGDEIEQVEEYLRSIGKKTRLHVPERGVKKQLCTLARENAAEHVKQISRREEKDLRGLMRLSSMLGFELLPEHIEAVDISNFGNEEITAGFVCFENGEPRKSGYRLYKMRDVKTQDDYASMREAVRRRIAHANDTPLPDLLLLDGGKGHVGVIKELLKELDVDLPVIGMVKDDYHKTRALTDGENEISIAGEQAVYMLIYKIQEEVHRFTYGTALRGKRKSMKHSVLEEIPGVGPQKAKLLLKMPGGLAHVREASVDELRLVKGITAADAANIYEYFHAKKGKEEK